MKIRPKKWSHHHVHRLYHISMGLCFVFIVLVIITGMVAFWLQAKADDNLPKTKIVNITAQVGGINSGPISEGNVVPVAPGKQIPTVTIYAEPYGQVPQKPLVLNGQTVPAYAFGVANPAFSGQASAGNSLLFISVQGPTSLNSTALAGNDGKWLWQSPQTLLPGTYLITVTVYNQNDFSKFSTAKTWFTVSPVAGGQSGSGASSGENSHPGVVDQPVVGKPLFGIFFEVLKEYKKINVGDKVVAAITIVRNGSNEQVQNQIIEYKVVGVDGAVIMESKDSVSFSQMSRFLKTILTAPKTKPGVYTVIVTSTYQGIISTASDTFVLEDVLPGTSSTIASPESAPVILWGALVGLLLLFLFLVLVAYHQVRLVSRHIREHDERWHKE